LHLQHPKVPPKENHWGVPKQDSFRLDALPVVQSKTDKDHKLLFMISDVNSTKICCSWHTNTTGLHFPLTQLL